MVRYLLRLAVFAFTLGIAYPALASPCPPGLPPSVTCNGFENYIYTTPNGAAPEPLASTLRIPAVPNPADGSVLYIPANLLATLNDPQILSNKTIDCHNNTCVNFPIVSAAPPLNLAGLSLSLAYDTTLSVVGGQLHVVSGGGITQLTYDIAAVGTGSVPATVIGLQGRPLSAAAPTTGQFIGWNGSVWLPVTPTGGGGSGFSGGITIASACTGTGCTPVTSCETFVNGTLSGFASGACGGGGGGAGLVGRNGGGTVGRNGGGSVARN